MLPDPGLVLLLSRFVTISRLSCQELLVALRQKSGRSGPPVALNGRRAKQI